MWYGHNGREVHLDDWIWAGDAPVRERKYRLPHTPSALDLMLEIERQWQLDAMWREWHNVPYGLREQTLKGLPRNQTDRILWAGWKKKLREIKDL